MISMRRDDPRIVPPQEIILGLYTYVVRRKGELKDEIRVVTAPSQSEAILMLAEWSPGIYIKKLVGINPMGMGGEA